MQIERSRYGCRERPLLLRVPLPAVIHAAGGILATGAAAHDEDPHGRLGIDFILRTLQPAVEPMHSQRQQVRRDVAGELRSRSEVDVAGERLVIVSVSPGTQDQALRTALALAECQVISSCSS